MQGNIYMLPILAVFIIVAVFGMPLMLSGSMHENIGCPFTSGEMALCAVSSFDHLRHWQIALATILAEIFVLCALALFFRRPLLATLSDTGQVRWRVRKHTPDRPTLLQELFARGI